MKLFLMIIGAIGVLLGGLWLVQGLGLVTIAPILCAADCEPLEGPSLPWALAGLVVLAGGGLAIWRGLRRQGGRSAGAR